MKYSAAIAACLLLSLAGCETGTPSPQAPLAPTRPAAVRHSVTIESQEEWSYIDPGGRVLSTENFRIFTTAKDGGVLSRLPSFTESSLSRYSSAFTNLPTPSKRIDIYFFAIRPQWARMTQSLMGAEAEKLLRIQRGGYAHRGQGVFFDIGPRDTFSLMAHEGWHQYTQTTFKQPLPVWLEEGIATTMEGFRWDDDQPDVPVFLPWANIERFEMLRTAITKKRLIPLDQIFMSSPQDELAKSQDGTLVYYAQVWALTLFLSEGENGKYRAGLNQLLQDAAAGTVFPKVAKALGTQAAQSALLRRRGPEIFTTYFPRDIQAVNGEYQAFITAITAVGAKEKIVQGQRPI